MMTSPDTMSLVIKGLKSRTAERMCHVGLEQGSEISKNLMAADYVGELTRSLS